MVRETGRQGESEAGRVVKGRGGREALARGDEGDGRALEGLYDTVAMIIRRDIRGGRRESILVEFDSVHATSTTTLYCLFVACFLLQMQD